MDSDRFLPFSNLQISNQYEKGIIKVKVIKVCFYLSFIPDNIYFLGNYTKGRMTKFKRERLIKYLLNLCFFCAYTDRFAIFRKPLDIFGTGLMLFLGDMIPYK